MTNMMTRMIRFFAAPSKTGFGTAVPWYLRFLQRAFAGMPYASCIQGRLAKRPAVHRIEGGVLHDDITDKGQKTAQGVCSVLEKEEKPQELRTYCTGGTSPFVFGTTLSPLSLETSHYVIKAIFQISHIVINHSFQSFFKWTIVPLTGPSSVPVNVPVRQGKTDRGRFIVLYIT